MQRSFFLVPFLLIFLASLPATAQEEFTSRDARLFITTAAGVSSSLMITGLAFASMSPQQGQDAALSTTISLDVSEITLRLTELTLLTTIATNRTRSEQRFSLFLTLHKDALLQDVHSGAGPVLTDVADWMGVEDVAALGRHARRRRAWLARILQQPRVDARAFQLAIQAPTPLMESHAAL